MVDLVSIIIPVRNGATTISLCLEAAFASSYHHFEVIVVDDASEDCSVNLIKKFPCKLIRLATHSGASKARNVGASMSKGEILFFTDADCLMKKDTLKIAVEHLSSAGKDVVLGGTYTLLAADNRFFSAFQSAFIHYFETRAGANPDYIATHAMVLYAHTFRASQGFSEKYLPILEDVDFSHRIRRIGHQLVMDSRIQVRHLFNYSFSGSFRNAFKKAMYWTIYSIYNKDLLADSGTSSRALKFNVVTLFSSYFFALLALITGDVWYFNIIAMLMVLNISMNRNLFVVFFRARGMAFALAAFAYYLLIYPLAVGSGSFAGVMSLPRYTRLLKSSD